MFNKNIGIDLGTSNTLIYLKGKGIVLNEPSLVAIEKKKNKVVGIGNEVKDLIGKNPNNIEIINPIIEGKISDFELTEIMLNHFIKKSNCIFPILRPVIVINSINNPTKVEINTLKELGERIGSRKTIVEENSYLSLLGTGLDINTSSNMIIDIGGGTTDIGIISMNKIESSKSLNYSGKNIDNEIIKYMKNKYKILITEEDSEKIKNKFIRLNNPNKYRKYEIFGKTINTGQPTKIKINQLEITKVVKETIDKIIKETKELIKELTPELSKEIYEKGIIITGGCSNIKGIAEYLEENLKIKILKVQYPSNTTIEGTKTILNKSKFII